MTPPVSSATLADARSRARSICAHAACGADRCDDVLLVLSELVGNACRHGGDPVTYDVTADGADLLVVVEDSDPTPPLDAPADVALGAENGRGLFLVAAVSRLWGWHPTARGKQVWARV